MPKSMAEKGLIGEKYLSMENLVVLPDKNYMKMAKKAAKAKKVICFKKPKKLDIRDFRMIYRVNKIPMFLKDLFFPVLIRMIDFILVKRIIK